MPKNQLPAPKWTELPARFLGTRGGRDIMGVVLHDTAGSGGHGDTLYLQAPKDGRQVSIDFTVERDGGIWKLNPDLDNKCCFHAGRATAFQGFKNAQVNQITVGIEIVQAAQLGKGLPPGLATPLVNRCYPYTPVQVESVATLCAWLAQTYNLTSDRITTHRNIIQDGSRSDPRLFPFDGELGFWHIYWRQKNAEAAYLESMSVKRDVEGVRREPTNS